MWRRVDENIHLIGTRTRDLPACSIVPRPTTLLRRTQVNKELNFIIIIIFFFIIIIVVIIIIAYIYPKPAYLKVN
jgi:hypothetical protein